MTRRPRRCSFKSEAAEEILSLGQSWAAVASRANQVCTTEGAISIFACNDLFFCRLVDFVNSSAYIKGCLAIAIAVGRYSTMLHVP